MRLENCILQSNMVAAAPFIRDQPEEPWIQARDTGSIPLVLYDLYCHADYLSFGSAPSFLTDQENVLFSYFGMLLRCLMESLVDADEQLRSFIEAQQLTYDFGKKIRGEFWDPTADATAHRRFRDLLIALQTALDALADLIALFFTGRIPGLRFGRGQFAKIEIWLERGLPPLGILKTPYDDPLQKLHTTLRAAIYPGPPEEDWLRLMRMLRNKAAHLGQPVFRKVGLHDATPRFYTFIPRQWPYLWEKHIRPHDPTIPVDPNFLPNHFRESLIHQDIVSFAQGLRGKVKEVIRTAIVGLGESYTQFKNFATNEAALAELQSNSEAYKFEYFVETGIP
jgi:hypothetical protein